MQDSSKFINVVLKRKGFHATVAEMYDVTYDDGEQKYSDVYCVVEFTRTGKFGVIRVRIVDNEEIDSLPVKMILSKKIDGSRGSASYFAERLFKKAA